MKKRFIILFILILATIFNWFIACKKSSNRITVTTPKDPVDSILGTYMGIVHYTYSFSSSWYPSEDSSFDTTYSFQFVVSKVSSDTFATNTSYTTWVFMGSSDGYFGYQYSNVYDLIYFACAGGRKYGFGTLKFSPTSDSASYNGTSGDDEGGGRIFSLVCTETFSGKKM